MFIHIGGDVTVMARSVIAILDAKRQGQAPDTQAFLKFMEEQGSIVRIDEAEQKSYVITDTTVYISPISSVTLKKRAEDSPLAVDESDYRLEG